jgi:hypothetical protein
MPVSLTRRAPSGITESRFADFQPASYDAKTRTVKAVLSVGAGVKRYYGTEVLEISAGAINLERLTSCGIPLIDSHNIFSIGTVFGRLERASIEGGELIGLVSFDDSDAGRKAEALVARGTVRGISIGYRVDVWEITDKDGNVVDPERERLQWDEEYTFTAKRWELLEVSLVSVPADPGAFIRSAPRDLSDAVLLQGASRITKRVGDISVTYEYPSSIAAPAQPSAAAAATIQRMRGRAAMLARQLVLEASLRAAEIARRAG